jgi:hypothetical protein
VAAGASRSEGRGGDDDTRDSAWLEDAGKQWIVVIRRRETFGHRKHCDEPR